MFSDPAMRKAYSEKTKQAWIDGKFDGVRVGQCKWISYRHSDGTTYKVQGTWELAFIKWLDKNRMAFKCHKGRLSYELYGEQHSYYPDFWVDEWNSYVDVKADCFYVPEKFDAVRACNPNVEVRILGRESLSQLGVAI
jgi:hypothetical protein